MPSTPVAGAGMVMPREMWAMAPKDKPQPLLAKVQGTNYAQITGEVQSKIAADANVQNKQIGVQSANGVVTLTGDVNSDMERTAAGNDAAQVAGVKTVINNMIQLKKPVRNCMPNFRLR